MTFVLGSYETYKKTDLPWLPTIPSHWDLTPNRGLIRKRKVLVGVRHSEFQLLSLTKQGVIVRDISTGKGKFSSDMGTSQEVRARDLIFCLFDIPETPRTVGLSHHAGMITGAYTVFESRGNFSNEYFEYFYTSIDNRKALSPLYSGLRNTITSGRFLGIKTPLPPLQEQEAIVRFLNWANGRLDRVIRSKRQLITLLDEQRQTIIQRAVTKGIDHSIGFKDTGIPWLGEIPEHWQLRRAKYLVEEMDARSRSGAETLLRVSQYTGVTPRKLSDLTGMARAESLVGYKCVGQNDLVINIMLAWNGSLGISKYDGIVSPAYCVYKIKGDVSPGYIHHLLRTKLYGGRIKQGSTGVIESRLRLYSDAFGQIEILLPSLAEQEKIIDVIDTETQEISKSITKLELEIKLLLEYKNRLMDDVVTGRIDVRDAVFDLPDEDYRDVHPNTTPLYAKDDGEEI